jgi:hypothetical protein
MRKMDKIRFIVTIDKEANRDPELEAMQTAHGAMPMTPKPAPDEFVFDTYAEVIDHLEALAIEKQSDVGIVIACRMNPTGMPIIQEHVQTPPCRSTSPARPSGQPARR